MKALSLDLRQRVLDALHSGQTHVQVAQRFSVSPASVGRLSRQFKEQGHLQPRPIPGRARAVAEPDKGTLQELITTTQDATLASLSLAFQEATGKSISKSALQRNLHWLGYS